MLALTLGVSTARAAPDSPKTPKPALEAAREVDKPAAATGASERRLLTGSYIPQQFRQDGRITTGPNNVQVLSAKSIQLTGAATLSRALGVLGANR